MKRAVACVSSDPGAYSRVLPDASCAALPKPSSQDTCMIKRCHKQRKAQWFVSTWQPCSVACGKGLQLRVVKCAEKDVAGKYRELSAKKCQHVPKPSMELQQTCVLSDCPVASPPSRPDCVRCRVEEAFRCAPCSVSFVDVPPPAASRR
ncbi:A disintegrin and metallo ase with thrombospondin motifs 16 [Labeo rohita]|uniref:A disintegrin and metallo ase with thrombospondin motifs 16 n=1 Tax=Labeo rohita TaxID=84645 RepID=A0A498MB66_LABRO|nr:A disintegrin and metallo ase with thrombospondin motifs 16 [Labeo rohita]